MIGGSRNDGDARRVEGLRKAVKDLDLEVYLHGLLFMKQA